jgi:hypothetical protein
MYSGPYFGPGLHRAGVAHGPNRLMQAGGGLTGGYGAA